MRSHPSLQPKTLELSLTQFSGGKNILYTSSSSQETALHFFSKIPIDILLPTLEAPPYQDILTLERVQCHATKHILNDYVSSYKSRLTTPHLPPLMYLYELNDIMFLIISLKNPSPFFNIDNFISFVLS